MDWLRKVAAVPGLHRLWRRLSLGSVETKTRFDVWDRPAYGYGVLSAATLARQLGHREMIAVEFGVARGDGLIALETICREVGAALGMDIAAMGFDSGCGMPKPTDYRDLPHLWSDRFYAMDEPALRQRLRTATLVIGDVSETVPEFVKHPSAPIGFISFDLDYYSSTAQAFRIFSGAASTRLPRVHCYFDDILWPERACYSEFTGEYLAIREFNEAHQLKKIAKLPHLHWMRPLPAYWNEQVYVFHDFAHPDYPTNLHLRSEAPSGHEMPI